MIGSKPYRWGFDPGFVNLKWDWFWRTRPYFLPLWDGAGNPRALTDGETRFGATSNSAVSWSSGGPVWDSDTDVIDLPDLTFLEGTAELSVGVIFNWTGADTSDTAFVFRMNDGSEQCQLAWQTAGRFRARIDAGGANALLDDFDDTSYIGVDAYVICTYDGVIARYYRDGVQIASAALSGSGDMDATTTYALGNASATTAQDLGFEGAIKQFWCVDKAFTAAQVLELSRDPYGPVRMDDIVPAWRVPAVAGANPKGPLGMPLHGPFGGPIG